ncbi:MAG TPA: hypothetical protein DDW30_07690 [Clostridiales bacterium]|nr:hypothetical protein [Clostridiales bacterium]
MKNRIFKSIRALFAAVLSVSLSVSVLSAFPAARAEETGSTAETKSYQYSVEIEFGAMTFCYDYGTWNPSNLRYEAEETEAPAAGTVAGFPGWYGFDGTANKISVRYNATEATEGTNELLQVVLSYRALTANDGGTSVMAGIVGVTPEFYGDTELTKYLGGSGTSLSVAKNDSTSVWLSLTGAPMNSVGSPFRSQTLIPIGMLTIALGSFSATEGGN